MDLVFSSACSEMFEDGQTVVARWLQQFPKDNVLEGIYDPVVAYDNNTPVGVFEVYYDYFEEIKWIQTLWVHPDHRHKGYGAAILDYLVETCNFKKLKLFAGNYSGPFYAKHGFENTLGSYYERIVNE